MTDHSPLRPARSEVWVRFVAALPYFLAAGLFALGLFALYKLLVPVNFKDVAAQIRGTPWSTLALALLATLGGYLSLAGYDWSALRYIGKTLPLPVVLTGGLMAYAFGNTIGLSAVSGGAVRWRVYSGLGLDGYDVAAVSTFAAVSFGVAATLVGLGALAVHPGALATLMPFAPGTLRLLAVAGIISHVPGGIGVFETVVIAAMPAGMPVDKVAAALLLYRMIYYLVPFVLALMVLAAYEAWKSLGGRVPSTGLGRVLAAMEPALKAVTPLTPLVLAVMIFGSGIWMSLAAILPAASKAAEAAEALFPLAFVEGSALVSSALGAGLIVLSLGIARRSIGAFWLALALMGVGAGVELAQGLDVERAGVLMLAVLILLPFRRAFHRRATLTHAALSPGWIALVLSTLAAFGFVLFFANKSTPYATEMWWQFAVDQRAPRALRAGLVASLMVALAALYLLLRAPRFRLAPPDAAMLAQVAVIVAAADVPDAGLALTGDKALMVSDDGQAMVMFGVAGRSWIAYGGPVGPAEQAADTALRFVDAARRAGARPVFYEVGAGNVPLMLDLGLALHKMGEEAVVDLTGFTLGGAARKNLRAAHARAGRDGLTLTVVVPPHDVGLMAELRVISDDWLAAKGTREKGFSVGRFDPVWLNHWPLALVWHQGRIVAFANILTTGTMAMATIDLMRHSAAAPPGTMEFLFTDLMLKLKAEGYRAFSLGMAPLSGLAPEKSHRLWDRFGALIYRHGGNFYNFEGLRAFKEKFDPDWHPHYLAAPSALPPLLPLADAARLIGGKAATGTA